MRLIAGPAMTTIERLSMVYAKRGYITVSSVRPLAPGEIIGAGRACVDGARFDSPPIRVVSETTREDHQQQIDMAWPEDPTIDPSWRYFYRVESD